MKKYYAVLVVPIVCLALSGCGKPTSEQPEPARPTVNKKSEPPKVYIDISYYNLRKEKSSLSKQSGLTSEDTQVKRDTVMNSLRADFRRRYVGKYVKWTGGYISNVEQSYDSRYICKIEMDKGAILSTNDISFPVTEQLAMDLKRFKEVLIDGRIKRLDGSLKIEMDNVTLSYTGRTLDDMRKRKSQNKGMNADQ